MQITPAELGYQPPQLKPDSNLPAGGGHFTTPHFVDFAAVVNQATRTYLSRHDEALKHSWENALAMRRDPVIFGALRERQIPVTQLSWHIEPDDETDQQQADAAELITDIVLRFPRWQQFLMLLQEAIWYGRYGCQIRYQWDYTKDNKFTGGRRMIPTGFIPVNGDKLRFKWDGSVGILIHSAYSSEIKAEQTDYGLAHFLDGNEREAFIVHRFEPEDADFWEPELAGGINGVGLRGRLYWFWYLKSQVMALMMNYIERFSNGLTLYYYDASNPSAKEQMEHAVREQNGNFALLIPRWANTRDTNSVERIEVSTASPALLQHLIDEYFDNRIIQTILGFSSSIADSPTILGTGYNDSKDNSTSRVIKYDAINLQATITDDLLKPLYRWNCGSVPCGRFIFDIDHVNAAELLGNAKIMRELGFDIDGDHLYEACGMPKPQQGSTVSSPVQPMSPAAVNQQPIGVPVAGSGLPTGQPQQ